MGCKERVLDDRRFLGKKGHKWNQQDRHNKKSLYKAKCPTKDAIEPAQSHCLKQMLEENANKSDSKEHDDESNEEANYVEVGFISN